MGQSTMDQTTESCSKERVLLTVQAEQHGDRINRPTQVPGSLRVNASYVGSYLRVPAVSTWELGEKVDSGCWENGDSSPIGSWVKTQCLLLEEGSSCSQQQLVHSQEIWASGNIPEQSTCLSCSGKNRPWAKIVFSYCSVYGVLKVKLLFFQ